LTELPSSRVSGRSIWERWTGKALLAFFVLAHMQDVNPFLAPISVVPLALTLTRSAARTRVPSVARWIGVYSLLLYLLAISLLNGTVTGNPVTFFRQYGAVFYTVGLLALFLFLAAEQAFVRAAIRIGFIASVWIGAFYLVLLAGGLKVSIAGAPMIAPRGTLLGLQQGKNPSAGVLGAFAAIAVIHYLRREPLTRRRWFSTGGTGLLVFLTFYVQSRGYSLALVCAVLFALWDNRTVIRLRTSAGVRLFRIAVLALVLLAGWTFISARFDGDLSRDANVSTRLDLWSRGLDRIEDSPLTGFGVGSFQQTGFASDGVLPMVSYRIDGVYLDEIRRLDVEGGLHAHNLYVQLLADSGVIGLVWFLSIPCLAFWKGRRRGIEGRELRTQFVYLAVAGVTGGLTMTSPAIAWPMMLLAAAVLQKPVRPEGVGPGITRDLPEALSSPHAGGGQPVAG
jgi:O-antigen ligase